MKTSDASGFAVTLTSHLNVPVVPLLAQGIHVLVQTAENCKSQAQLDAIEKEAKTWQGNLDRLGNWLEVLVAKGIIDEADQERTMETPNAGVAVLLKHVDAYKRSREKGTLRKLWHSREYNNKLVEATTALQRAWNALMAPLFGYNFKALLHIAESVNEVVEKGNDTLKLLELVSIHLGVETGAMTRDALKSEVARMKNLKKLNAVNIKPTDVSDATERLHKSASSTVSVVEFRDQPAVSKTFTLQPQSGKWSVKARKDCFRELDALTHMSSPYVVQVYGLIKDSMPHKLVLVMEHLQEGDLRKRLDKEPPLEPKTRQRIVLGIARGMEHLHRNEIPHRHLTSSNVLLAGEGQDLRAKISDFGMADMENAITTSGLSSTLVTPSFRWRPPEQFNMELLPSTRREFMKGDVYSFGVICWEIVTDKKPWDGESNTCKVVGNAVMDGKRLDIPRNISTGYSELIEDCWRADLNGRPGFKDIAARVFALCNESLTVDIMREAKCGRLLVVVAAFMLLVWLSLHAGRGWLNDSCSLAEEAAPDTAAGKLIEL